VQPELATRFMVY